MTFLGLVDAFEYDGEASPKCFFSEMRSVSATSLSGNFPTKPEIQERSRQIGKILFLFYLYFWRTIWLGLMIGNGPL